MNRLIEDYLVDVATNLQPIPIKQRNEEIKEMRQHLQNAVIVNREFGQSEDEASVNAIEQFGQPKEIGIFFIHAWQRDRKLDQWSFWGAAVCIFPALFYLPCVQSSWLEKMLFSLARQFFSEDAPVSISLIVSVTLAVTAGLGIGWVFGRRAVIGVTIGTSLWLLVQVFVFPTMLHIPVLDIPDYIGPWVSQLATASALTVLTAWAGSHWHNGKDQRSIAATSCQVLTRG